MAGLFSLVVPLCGDSPDWSRLDKYKGTMERAEFVRLLDEVFVPRKSWRKNWVELDEDAARIRRQAGKDEWYVLPFAKKAKEGEGKLPKEYWRPADALRGNAGAWIRVIWAESTPRWKGDTLSLENISP